MSTTSIQSDLSTLFSDFANKTLTQPMDGIDPVLHDPTPPVAVVSTTVAAPVEPVVAPSVTVPAVVQPVTTTVEAKVDDWDLTVPAAPVAPATPAVPSVQDYSKFAGVLGKEKISTEDELVKEITSVKSELESLKTLPEPLSRAIEVAKQGGNYLEYLGVSQVDWSKEDPITLYENYVEDQFTSREGTVDYEKVDKILEKLDDDEKELRGRELQNKYIGYQQDQKARLELQARNQKAQFETSLRDTLQKLDEVGSFKLKPAHKEEIFADILSGKDLQFSSLEQRAVAYFIRKNWDKIDTFRRQQIKNATSREILNEAQLPEIRTPEAQQTITPSKGYSMDDFLKEITTKRNF